MVRGLQVGRLLGQGGSSSVWLVTDDSGQRFALKVAGTRTSGPAQTEATAAPGQTGTVADGGARRRGRRAAPPPAGRAARAPATVHHGSDRPGSGVPSGRAAGAVDIERELRLLQRLAHEHLVRVHRLVDTDQGPGMLMDLAAGGSLLELVASRGPLPIAEVVTALVPVAQVLAHLHAAGAVHGDVTPGNILFTQEGKPLLGDLDAGRLLGAEPRGAIGTPGFLDPVGNGSFDTRSDIFALAAVSWFALTGRVPGPTEHRPPLTLIVPEVPPALLELIEDGLSSSRERRPGADEFARTLLASGTPAPVDLVPAVHASVLPELLTRRAASPSAAPRPVWGRVLGLQPGARRASVGDPGMPLAGRRPSEVTRRRARQGSAVEDRGRAGNPRDSRRPWALLAVTSGLAAVVLLLAGTILPLDGRTLPDDIPNDPFGRGPIIGQGAEATERATRGTGSTDRRPITSGPEEPAKGSPSRAAPATGGRTEAAPAGHDPAAALDALVALRAAAFATADPALLAAVDIEGSPAMTADRESVAALADSGRILRDLSITIRDATVLSAADVRAMPAVGTLPSVAQPPASIEVAVVRATADVSSYTEAAASPSTSPATVPGPSEAAGHQELFFILWKTASGWRIHSVLSPVS